MLRLIDADILLKEGWVLHKMVGTTLHEMPLNCPSIPTVDAEPVKHGHWINKTECSVCGEWEDFVDGPRNYCPNCGAKMDEVEDAE